MTVVGKENLRGTGLGIRFWTRGGLRRASKCGMPGWFMRRATLKRTALVAGLLAILPAAASAGPGREDTGTAPHPRLFFDSGDLPRLRARLRKGTVGGFCGEALTALLHGKRDDKSIAQLMSKRDPHAGCLIYDFQYPFMTDDERKQKQFVLACSSYRSNGELVSGKESIKGLKGGDLLTAVVGARKVGVEDAEKVLEYDCLQDWSLDREGQSAEDEEENLLF